MNPEAKHIHITGLVQGVGFRPFIYRLAKSAGINGWVENNNDGVRIHAEGLPDDVLSFIGRISAEAPVASQIAVILQEKAEFKDYKAFEIRKSADISEEITEISPDIAVCEDCLADMKHQAHRLNYPFINCTNCGPRFSIIQGLPYDREKTTMKPFRMCPVCRNEYSDITDRRFHAQPVACMNCGPVYTLVCHGMIITRLDDILTEVVKLIQNGGILAIKGIGGFHLACDATSDIAVSKLRQRKVREGKPFAVMFKSIADVKQYMEAGLEEQEYLNSWRRPIVILKNAKGNTKLAGSVSNGFNTTGVMLPYMPLHYLLFEKLNIPALVMTSGNLSDEPVIIDNDEACNRLKTIADATLVYNRDIFNRTDDSVTLFTGKQGRLIRRSRGYSPGPLTTELNVDGIFASGAELVNCFGVGKGNRAILSQHIGDLKNLETLEFYKESLSRFIELFRVKPGLVACDLHPDYLSTRFAGEFSQLNGNLPVTRIQHHHAHIASCMAEHGLDENVIGIAMDGVGYGTDGHIWGFEVMTCDLLEFERKIHLEYVPQPGGDMANLEPWRMAVSFLFKYYDPHFEQSGLPFLENIPEENLKVIKFALENKINTPLTSSAGRLFDAVAAMTGICHKSAFHAEAPMRLEDCIDPGVKGRYEFQVSHIVSPGSMIQEIVRDIKSNVPVHHISTKFHRTLVEMIAETAEISRKETGINKVVLSGGIFQNRFIMTEAETRLAHAHFAVFSQRKFPSNDGGIALGQLAIAAKRRHSGYF